MTSPFKYSPLHFFYLNANFLAMTSSSASKKDQNTQKVRNSCLDPKQRRMSMIYAPGTSSFPNSLEAVLLQRVHAQDIFRAHIAVPRFQQTFCDN